MKKGAVDRCHKCSRHSPNPEQLEVVGVSQSNINLHCMKCDHTWDVPREDRDCSGLKGYAEAMDKFNHSPRRRNDVWQ